MTASLIQNANASSSGSVTTVTLGSATTAGNTLIAGIAMPASASVVSIVDGINRWIRCSNAGNATTPCTEIWYARGVQGGSVTAVITTNVSGVGANVSEFSGLFYADPLDSWSQNLGTSTTPTAQSVTPRATGDLFYAVCSSSVAVTGGPTNSYTSLTVPGTGHAAAYLISSGSVASNTSWTTGSSNNWAVAEACFRLGPAGTNPNGHLQFPEVLVELSPTSDWVAPLLGTGYWVNMTRDVRSMNIGPLGRGHLLDRINATPAEFTMDNRSNGAYSPWNLQSYISYGGLGLKPQNPIRVDAAWAGITHRIFTGYFQNVTTSITDVLNVDATIQAVDALQLLSLKYLSSASYAQVILSGN